MSHNPKMSFYEELEDIGKRVAKASDRAREGRALALDREDIQMVRLLKEIQLLLESVL